MVCPAKLFLFKVQVELFVFFQLPDKPVVDEFFVGMEFLLQ